MRFKDNTVVITGGAQGLGFATAERVASEGARIALIDMNGDGAAAAAEKLRAAGAEAESWQADVSDERAVNQTMAAVLDRFGGAQALINSCGIYPAVPFEETTIEHWRHVMAVNVESTFLCTQALWPAMKEAGYGRIVNFSSGTVLKGRTGMPAYVTSKAALIGFTRVMAKEGGEFGITVNAVAPGLIETEGVIGHMDHTFDLVIAGQAVKRRGQPADIAEAIAYLASPDAGFITGQTLAVEGGGAFL